MDFSIAAGIFVIGLGLIFYFTEELVKGVVGTSLGFGITSFLISIIFIGLHPENLIVGAISSSKGSAGIALGSVIGAAMVVIALVFGLRAVISPVLFQSAPKRVIAVPVLAEILFGLLSLDGRISRTDGSVLLLGFVLSTLYILHLSKRGLDIKPTGEVLKALEKGGTLSRRESASLLVISLVAIIIASEMLVAGSDVIMARFNLSDTVFGMTILTLLVNLEVLARELPASWGKKEETGYESIIGSIPAFFLFNAGVIATINPTPVSDEILSTYLPLCIITTLVLSVFMLMGRLPRIGGVLLLLLYTFFFIMGFVRI